MNILFHGENISDLKNRLQQIKDSFDGDIVSLDGKILTEELLIQNLNSGSLFQIGKKLIIIENLSANKSLPEKELDVNDNELIIAEDKKLTTTQIKALQKLFPDLKEEEFKIDPVVFKFLDSLEPGNVRKTLQHWDKYKATEAPEIIMVMLARQFRLLLLASSNNPQQSPDWARLSPWQKQKLISQASKFTSFRLKTLFAELADLDFKSKTGQNPLDLQGSLELFLLGL